MAVVVATASVTFDGGELDKDISAQVETARLVDADPPFVSDSAFRFGQTPYLLLYLSTGVSVKRIIVSHKECSVTSDGGYVSNQEDFLTLQTYEKESDKFNEVKTKYPMNGSFTHEYFGDDLGTPLALSDQTLRVPEFGISSIKVNYEKYAQVYRLSAPLGLKTYQGKVSVQVVFVCEKK